MRQDDVILTVQWRHGSTCGQRAADARLFDFYLSIGLIRVCEINRIHHWCSVGTETSQLEGPPFQWETRLAEFPTEQWTQGLGFFWNHLTPMIDSFPYGTVGETRKKWYTGQNETARFFKRWCHIWRFLLKLNPRFEIRHFIRNAQPKQSKAKLII